MGKTWLLQEFGRNEYAKFAFVSLDRNTAVVQLLRSEKRAESLLRGLSALLSVDITPGDTLLVMDEVQDCPESSNKGTLEFNWKRLLGLLTKKS